MASAPAATAARAQSQLPAGERSSGVVILRSVEWEEPSEKGEEWVG